MKGRIPGFRFFPRQHRAKFELILPRTGATKRRRTTVEAATRGEALELWKEWRDSILTRRRTKSITLAEYRKSVWEKVIKGLAPKTAGHESWMLDKVLLPILGQSDLSKINDAVTRDLVAELRSVGYSPATINGIIAVLRKILRDAVDRELLAEVPVRKFPRQVETPPRLELSLGERERFIAAFDDEAGFRQLIENAGKPYNLVSSAFFDRPRKFGGGRQASGAAAGYEFQRFRNSKPLFIVALETGLAQGDLLTLRWSSIDLKEGWIRVPRAKTKVEAIIPISELCREALAECLSPRVVGERVFLTEAAQPFSVSVVNRYFVKAKTLAGITRRFRFHDLRHSFASLLASKGVSIQVIAKALGHSSTSMAERYARPSEESLKVISEALNSAKPGSAPRVRKRTPNR